MARTPIEGTPQLTGRLQQQTAGAARFPTGRGFSSGIAGVAVSQGVFYYAYELIREKLASPPASPKRTFTNMENLVIGAVAGAVGAFRARGRPWPFGTRA